MPIAEERFILSLEKAKQELDTADHLAYMTYPLIRENRLLLKILEKLYYSVLNAINAVLQYEYMYKRITLYKDTKINLETFKKISPKYHLNEEQLKKIIEIISLGEKHKKSPFEFAKNNQIVIMSDNLSTETLTIEKIKAFIIEIKDFLRKTNQTLKPV